MMPLQATAYVRLQKMSLGLRCQMYHEVPFDV